MEQGIIVVHVNASFSLGMTFSDYSSVREPHSSPFIGRDTAGLGDIAFSFTKEVRHAYDFLDSTLPHPLD